MNTYSIGEILKQKIPNNLLIMKLPHSFKNSVLLTFDDGPHPEITAEILDLLDKYNARAVFFIVGRRIERAPELLREIIVRGHMIGNHTYIHSNTKQPNFLRYWSDINKCQDLIETFTSYRPKLFRPPGGRISIKSILIPRLLGFKVIKWSIETNDWACKSDVEAKKTANKIINKIQKRDILTLHDDNKYVILILKTILPFLASKNFDLYNGINAF